MRRYSPLLLILVLLGSLAVSQTAFAASSTSPLAPTAAQAFVEPEEEAEGEEEEFEVVEEIEFEACEAGAEELEFAEFEEAEEEEFEEEVEECEEEAKKGKGASFVTAPAACLVHRAESTITTLPGSDRVRLTIHYTNYSPASVAIGLRLKDHKGSLWLERTTKHLGRSGVLHLTTKLGEAEMERAEKAREFDVELRAADTPGYCSDLLEQHLVSKQSATKGKAHGSRVYSAPHHA
ncbi:MAG TPA: hypothetical protein VH268_10355 [Solirubrobacterales bacterium]|jgi:hypothetical protein|nr:hypothetical protein [Solirubrobacterales bacterium]